MKFLFVNPMPFPSTRAYGIQMAKTADALMTQGHDVEFIQPAYDGPFGEQRDDESVKRYFGISRLPVLTKIPTTFSPKRSFGFFLFDRLNYLFVTWEFASRVRKELVHRVSKMSAEERHSSAIVTRDPMMAWILGKKGLRVFWEIHTLGQSWRTRLALNAVSGVISITTFSMNAVCTKFGFPMHASCVLPSGVDVARFMDAPSNEEARTRLHIDPSLKVYAFAGRFQEAWKGAKTLVGIAKGLNADERLLLVGDMSGAVATWTAMANEEGVDLSRVILTGQVAPSDIPAYLAAADVLLLPNSEHEPIGREHTSPLKLFEYLAVRRPIVASDLPAFREVVSESQVWFAKADDPSSFLNVLRSVDGSSEDADTRVTNGRSLAAAYDWGKRASRLVEFAEERLDPSPSVIVPIFDGAISKNIIDSGSLEPLREQGYRVLLWVHESKADYYRKRYGRQGYRVAEYGEPRIPAWANYLQNFATDCIPTRSLFLKHVKRMIQKKNYVLGCVRIVVWSLGHIPPIRWVIQHLELVWLPPLKVRSLIHVERPSLVFCPTMVWLAEVQLVRYAKRLGIRTVGMCKSWDNITSKLILPVKPDHLLVPSDRCAAEAVRYLSYPRSRISVVGLAQFDRYQDPKLQESRDTFCARVGLDPAKPYVLFCAAGLWMAPDEPKILLDLDRAIESGQFGPLHVLVRMHPKYDCGAEQLKACRHIVLDRPGTYIGKDLQDWEYEDQDLTHLISSLKYAAVTISTASTMSIEAAYFDRPVINIAFDPVPTSYYLSVARYYEREHCAPIVTSKGTQIATSQTELEKQIADYLAHPEQDHGGRERIILEQCVSREPIAARRIADALLKQTMVSHD